MSDGSSEWQPLSARRGVRPVLQLCEGVPDHMVRPLAYWLQGIFGYRTAGGMFDGVMLRVATAARVPLLGNCRGAEMQEQILSACAVDEDLFLDVVDATLRFNGGAAELQLVLEAANSVWTVGADGRTLDRRVDPTAASAYEAAVAPQDSASAELSEAWSHAHALHGDPSDAWDHAIKAVEAVLIPIVCANQDRPTLGHVLGQLRGSTVQWKIVLPGSDLDHDATPLVSMLQLLWPNPDRHGSAAGSRTPTVQEARAAVQLAVTLVQWARDGSPVIRR